MDRGREVEGVGLVAKSTPATVVPQEPPPSEMIAEEEVAPVVRDIKTEQAESTTPLDRSPTSSSFISSLKVCTGNSVTQNGG